MSTLEELLQSMTFEQHIVGEMLDNYDPSDPHRRQDEFDDKQTAPLGNQPFYDTSTSTPIKDTNKGLDELPDYSDEVLSDYRIQQMLGREIEIPNIVDLDTAPNYVDFIKNTIRTVINSENEFNIDSKENLIKNINTNN